MAESKNYFKRVVSKHPGFTMADLEDTNTSAMFKPGDEVEFSSEFGWSKARYVRNIGSATVEYGRAMQAARLVATVVKGVGSAQRFGSTATIGHDFDWTNALCTIVNAGDAAPEGQCAVVIKHTSATTSYFDLDRALTAVINTNDRVVLQNEGHYQEATLYAAQPRRTPGVVASYGGIASGSYGWVIVEGVHPAATVYNDVTVATGTGVKVHSSGGWLATGTTNLIGYPLEPVDSAAATRSWPVKLYRGIFE